MTKSPKPKFNHRVQAEQAAKHDGALCHVCGHPKWRHFIIGGPDMVAHSFVKR